MILVFAALHFFLHQFFCAVINQVPLLMYLMVRMDLLGNIFQMQKPLKAMAYM